MFTRIINYPKSQSFFLLGPRATGKSSWVKSSFPGSVYLDLLIDREYADLLANPDRLESRIPPNHKSWVVIDEVQRVPQILNTVHRLIESRKIGFVLTGSSARKLRRSGVNLLAGRALTKFMHPLVASELGGQFKVEHGLKFGMLPMTFSVSDPFDYLKSYVGTYLREEVRQEGLVRNMSDFARFLEAASLSQASTLNIASVARDSAVAYETTHDYFEILEDLLIAVRVPLFSKRAKRKYAAHSKFFFFDSGVYRALRPRGPLDTQHEIDGACLETLFLQHVRALNDYNSLDYSIYYWRSSSKHEVDFVLYGSHGLLAFEIKRSATVRSSDLKGLYEFKAEFPESQCFVLYGGERSYFDDFQYLPYSEVFGKLEQVLSGNFGR